MTNLIRSELLRIWSRRMVKVLAIVAIVGSTAGVMIGAIQSHPARPGCRRNGTSRPTCSVASPATSSRRTSFHPATRSRRSATTTSDSESYVNNSLQALRAAGVLEGDRVHPDRAGSDHRRVVRWGGLAGRDDGRALDLGTTTDPGLPGPGRGGGRVRVRARGRPAVLLSVALAAAAALRGTTVDTGGSWFAGVVWTVLQDRRRLSARRVDRRHARDGRSEHRRRARCRVRLSRDRGESLARIHPEDLRLTAQHQPRGIRRRQGRHVGDGKRDRGRKAVLTITIYAVALLAIALALFRTRDVT